MPVEKLDRHGCNFLELITVGQTDENDLEKLISLLIKGTGGIARGLRGYLFLLKNLRVITLVKAVILICSSRREGR